MTQHAVDNSFAPGLQAPDIGRFGARREPVLNIPKPVPTGYGSWRQYRDDQALKRVSNEDTIADIVADTDDLLSDEDNPYTRWYVTTMQMYYLAGALRRQKRLVAANYRDLSEFIDCELAEDSIPC